MAQICSDASRAPGRHNVTARLGAAFFLIGSIPALTGTGSRLLIIPAAGIGSRLGADVPKVLVKVGGTTMLERLLNLYRPWVGHIVLVVNPASEDPIRKHVQSSLDAGRITCVQQPQPTGMLDAILGANVVARRTEPTSVWITWCDQIGVQPGTIARLGERTSSAAHACGVSC